MNSLRVSSTCEATITEGIDKRLVGVNESVHAVPSGEDVNVFYKDGRLWIKTLSCDVMQWSAPASELHVASVSPDGTLFIRTIDNQGGTTYKVQYVQRGVHQCVTITKVDDRPTDVACRIQLNNDTRIVFSNTKSVPSVMVFTRT